jgi:ribosomal protein L11 methylase PrmA
LSGFFTTDNDELIAAATAVGLTFEKSKSKENWSMLKFIKN